MILGISFLDFLKKSKEAKMQSGKTRLKQFIEILNLRKGPGKLSGREYYDYRLFEKRFSSKQQKTFAGTWIRNDVWIFQDPQWCGVGSDKLLSYLVLDALGLPIAPVKAIYGAQRYYPNAEILKSPEDLLTFLRNKENYPFFSKPSAGAFGRNTCYAKSYDESSDSILTTNGKNIRVEDFSSIKLPNELGGFLFQEIIKPHPDLSNCIGERVATARIITMRTENGVRIHRAAFRIPVGNNITDNFNLGSGGNGFSDIDIETGRLGKMHVGLGLSLRALTEHPDTKQSVEGFHLPHWEQVLAVIKQGQESLFGLPAIGWDIAFTETGPVIVEFNTNPGYALLQATGRGFLDEEFRKCFPADPAALRKRYPHIEIGIPSRRKR